jgi:hypothetical protein
MAVAQFAQRQPQLLLLDCCCSEVWASGTTTAGQDGENRERDQQFDQ